ncbi:FUSC family protein [Xanthobacter autotrophicus DSM 431]|uniref:FUSC family protein n=1 Tax=Xanthobacter nonsaccharivorans TaxID=3119912 RepID=UPI00372C7ED1
MSSSDNAPAPSGFKARLAGLVSPAHLKVGLRAAVAGLAAYGIAYGLALPNGYWAVLSAVVVVQSTIGASLKAALDRALGTLVGGAVGVAAAVIADGSLSLTVLTFAIAAFVTATVSARSASFRLAPATVVIVLLADPGNHEPWLAGLHRVFEIGVGGVVGMLAAVLIVPERALFRLFPHCAKALRVSARLLELGRDGLLGRGLDPGELDRLNSGARAALRAADARIAEARTERAGGFVSHADPAPVVRNCRRLWHSVIILLRVADQPMAAPVVERIAPVLDAAVAALAAQMEALAVRLDGAAPADAADGAAAVAAAVVALETQAEQLSTDPALADVLRGDTLAALFAAVTACGQARENLEELAARLAEVEGEAAQDD